MCTKTWDSSYNELLDRLHLPTLAQRRLHLSLCFMYRIIHRLLYFHPNIIVPSSTSSHYTRSYSLYQPFARTDSYLHSFLPNTVSQWNTLPEYIVASPSLPSLNVIFLFSFGTLLLASCYLCIRMYIAKVSQKKKKIQSLTDTPSAKSSRFKSAGC